MRKLPRITLFYTGFAHLYTTIRQRLPFIKHKLAKNYHFLHIILTENLQIFSINLA